MVEKRLHKIFGTDGVRGKANQLPMTPETALALGRAAGSLFKNQTDGRARIVIGKDTRLSCYVFENALIAGLCSMGVDTLMVGPLPTPGVAFITRAYRAQAGIVISASHNPYHDNGIKFFDSEGFKLPDSWELKIEEMLFHNNFFESLPADQEIGKNTKVADADGRYVEFVKGTFPRGKTLKNLKIVLDCANGAGYRVAPLVFQELDAKVFASGIKPNGLNINESCGSTHPEATQQGVKFHQADVGIALDGDADRVIMVDEKGQLIDGDIILAICARDMKQKNLLKNNCVIATVMSNLGSIRAMESCGIKVICSQVGDRYVIQDMLKHQANLGGEQSGHVIFKDYNTTGDGLVCALQVLRIMMETNLKLSELAAFVKPYPQTMINIEVRKKTPLKNLPRTQKAIAEIEHLVEKTGRLLVRYSGTENICRVMVEGQQKEVVEELAKQMAQVIQEEIGLIPIDGRE